MSQSDKHQNVLRDWIASATADLSRAPAKRLTEEYEDHYAQAFDAAVDTGLNEDDAHRQAMRSLGDSRAVHLASIPVHGDPYRLKVKGVLALIGIIVIGTSLNYRVVLTKRANFDYEAFEQALASNDVDAIEELLEARPNLNQTGTWTTTPLGPILSRAGTRPAIPLGSSVIRTGHEDDDLLRVAELLLASGVDPNLRVRHSPLWYRVFRLHGRDDDRPEIRAELLDLLVEYGADIYKRDAYGQTPIEYVSERGDNMVAEKLRDLGAKDTLETLMYRKSFDELMNWIEKDPELIHTTFRDGATIPMVLVSGDQIDLLKRALELGGDLERVDDLGRTALHYALSSFHRDSFHEERFASVEMMSYLLNMGMDFDTGMDSRKTNEGMGISPFMLAIEVGNSEAVTFFLKHGADPNATINLGYVEGAYIRHSAFSRALRRYNEHIVIVLIEAGADIFPSDVNLNPVHFAADWRMHEVLKILVNREVSINEIFDESDYDDRSGMSGKKPIHVAAADPYSNQRSLNIIDSPETLILLLEMGEDINERDANGRTPIFTAFANSKLNVARYLLEQGADPTIADEDGKTPLHTDRPDIAALFKEFGFETISDKELARL